MVLAAARAPEMLVAVDDHWLFLKNWFIDWRFRPTQEIAREVGRPLVTHEDAKRIYDMK